MSTEKEGAGSSPAEKLRGWFAGRLPGDWFTGPVSIETDREEITVIGEISPLRARLFVK